MRKSQNSAQKSSRPKKIKPGQTNAVYIKEYWPSAHISTLREPTQLAIHRILHDNKWVNPEDVCWCWDGASLYINLTTIGQGLRILNGLSKNFDASDFLKKKGWDRLLDCALPVCQKECFQMKPEGQVVKAIWYLRLDPGLELLLAHDLPSNMHNHSARQLALSCKAIFKTKKAQMEEDEAAKALLKLTAVPSPVKVQEPAEMALEEQEFFDLPVNRSFEEACKFKQEIKEEIKKEEPTLLPNDIDIVFDEEYEKLLEQVRDLPDVSPNQEDNFSLWDVSWW